MRPTKIAPPINRRAAAGAGGGVALGSLAKVLVRELVPALQGAD
jgi:hypothetical protein